MPKELSSRRVVCNSMVRLQACNAHLLLVFLSFFLMIIATLWAVTEGTLLPNVLYVINVRLATRSYSFQRHAVSSSRKDPQAFRRPLIQGRKNWCHVSLGLLKTRLGAHPTMWLAISEMMLQQNLRFLFLCRRIAPRGLEKQLPNMVYYIVHEPLFLWLGTRR